MNIADKIACANTLSVYLHGTDIDAHDELRGRGWSELISDPEFERVFVERCWRCPDCGSWAVNDGSWVAGHPPCDECSLDEDWDYE